MTLRTIKRRRREFRTDYKLREGLLRSSVPRIVVRKSNKYFMIQVIETREAQDKILFGVTSKDLLENGWDAKAGGSLKSIPAAYLTGMLAAKKIKGKDFILDLGMYRNQKGGRIYAVGAGLIDGGLNIKMDTKVFPSKERLLGEHLKPELKEMIAKVKQQISGVSAPAKKTKN